ncbi:hypothetical protein SAMN05216276_1016146 [Streptosporangium subroseum]|uniref:Uncharacterized protein n=1 Tax=Streptosporangium subroseum TaxID=106412 RepID=A0A239HLK6_9ACTN|nr:hypothetical protein SAMN05216276_1016146 [Streptosporangium subroseum]
MTKEGRGRSGAAPFPVSSPGFQRLIPTLRSRSQVS